MMKKLLQNQPEPAASGFLSLSQNKIEFFLFSLITLFLPTQLGKHFWPDFSYVLGIRVDYLSPTIYLTDILVALLFVFWLARIVTKNSEFRIQSSELQIKIKNYFPISMYIFAFCFLLFNIIMSGRILGGLYSLLKFLEMSFVAYYIAKFIDLKKQTQKIILLFSIGVIFESVLAIGQFIKQGSVGGVLYFLGERTFDGSTPGIANASLNDQLILRPSATFSHPNVLAGYLVVTMTLILFLFSKQKNLKIKLLHLASIVIGTIGLVLTLSRIAILLWVLIVVFYFFTKVKNRFKYKKVWIGLLIGIFLLGILLFILSPFGARFKNISATDEAVFQRKVLIDSSLSMIKKSPLLGVGLGNFLPILSKIQKPLSLGLYLQPVHNIFLLVAAETGLIGLGFFIWFLFRAFQKAKSKKQKATSSLLIALSSILILGMFDHYWLTLQQGQLVFAFIIGFCYNVSSKTI